MADKLLLPSWILKIEDKSHVLYGQYECPCETVKPTTELILKHIEAGYDGHCENGIKVKDINGTLEYWCICGKCCYTRNDIYAHRERADFMCVERHLIKKAKECDICLMSFSSPEEAKRHFKTKKHLKNLNPEEHRLVCKECNIECRDKNAFNKHLNTEKHKKKLNPEENTLECTLCNIKCFHQSVLDKHLNTTKHKKKLNPDLYSKFECKVCKIKVNSQRQMDTHLQTNKHLKMLKINPYLDSVVDSTHVLHCVGLLHSQP
jgi:hypothetical protein